MTTSNTSGKFLTYPSATATIFDIPEPKDISAKFFYNYFLANERESTDTYVSKESFQRHREKYARHIEVSFTPLNAIVPDSPVLTEVQLSRSQKIKLFRSNKDKILKETDFNGPAFSTLQFQDAGISSIIMSNIESALLQKAITTRGMSPLETVLRYASETTENVDGQSILDSVNVDELNEYATIDPATGKSFEVQKTGDVNKLTFSMTVNEKFIGDIATAAVKTPISPAGNMLASNLSSFKDDQAKNRKSKKSSVIAASDFVGVFNPVKIEKVGIDDVFLGGNTVMGYRVRRTRVDLDSDVMDIFIENTAATSYIDTDVLYGVEYKYAISVVYLVKLFGYNEGNIVSADVLIESRESPSISILCNEVTPPVAPDGLEFYLLQNGSLMIEWDYPINSTEDIKRFQIFRRSSILSPFQIIGQLDFDDSTIRTKRSENIYDFLNIDLNEPMASFNDVSFDIDSKHIYAVCSVDAHDLSSPYSEQFMVSFDKFSASLNIEFISEKNAPKPYPNFVLRNSLTEDVIRDSNHNSVSCYFDPEYLKVMDGDGHEIDFLQSSADEVSYKLQLIHLNMQQNIVADINIK